MSDAIWNQEGTGASPRRPRARADAVLHRAEAAVDDQRRAGGEACPVARQVEDGVCDVLGAADPEWMGLADERIGKRVGKALDPEALTHRRLDRARSDRVDADTER